MRWIVLVGSLMFWGCGAPVQQVGEVDGVDGVDEVDGGTPEGGDVAEGMPEGAALVLASELPPVERFFELRYESSWNVHGEFGAMDKHLSSKVVLELREQNVARVVDQGEQRDSVLDERWGYNEDVTFWRNVWLGKWTGGEGALVLELELCERECEKAAADVAEQKVTAKCPELRARVTVECGTEQVMAGPDPACLDEERSPQEVWICFPTGDDPDLGGSPPAWVFGKDVCLEIDEGPLAQPRVYSVCREEKPPAAQ